MCDAILRQPQGADEPGVALSQVQIVRHLVIIIVLVARHPANLRFRPQRLLELLHGTLDLPVGR